MKKNKQRPGVPPGKVLTYYPLSYVLLYNGATIMHFFIGAYAIVLGYNFLWFKYLFGLIYLLFAFITSYIVLPLSVCPHCPYFTLENSRCSSGLNIIANLITTKGNPILFNTRATGGFSFDNLFTASLLLPFALIIPAFILNFSIELVIALVLLLGSLAFRLFYVIPSISCSHCKAQRKCTFYKRQLLFFTAHGRNPG